MDLTNKKLYFSEQKKNYTFFFLNKYVKSDLFKK